MSDYLQAFEAALSQSGQTDPQKIAEYVNAQSTLVNLKTELSRATNVLQRHRPGSTIALHGISDPDNDGKIRTRAVYTNEAGRTTSWDITIQGMRVESNLTGALTDVATVMAALTREVAANP